MDPASSLPQPSNSSAITPGQAAHGFTPPSGVAISAAFAGVLFVILVDLRAAYWPWKRQSSRDVAGADDVVKNSELNGMRPTLVRLMLESIDC